MAGLFRLILMLAVAASMAAPSSGGAAPPTAPGAAAAKGEKFDLETSDGVALAAWYYAAPRDEKPLATVILVHDLEGSHKSVEPLALALQRDGCAVVAPDLRGHGASAPRSGTSGSEEKNTANMLKKSDLEMMAATAGGRVREQAAIQGDIETVRNFIRRKAEAGELDMDRLCVVGCGTGATLAALWTAADAAWPPLASGPQGQQVRALVLISPAWVTKGLTIAPALASDAFKKETPIMVVAGADDRDAVRLADQMKRNRPREWFDQREGQKFTAAKDLTKDEDAEAAKVTAKASFVFWQSNSKLSGDKLAAEPAARAAALVKGFLSKKLGDGEAN